MDDAEILSRVGLFSLMKKRDLRRIAKLAKRHSYTRGEVIVTEGARDGRLFIIISGEVEVIKNLGAEGEKPLRILRPGNYFGEMALVYDYIRTASVVARDDTDLLSLYHWNIREEIKKYPSIAIELLQTLGRRLVAAENEKSEGERSG